MVMLAPPPHLRSAQLRVLMLVLVVVRIICSTPRMSPHWTVWRWSRSDTSSSPRYTNTTTTMSTTTTTANTRNQQHQLVPSVTSPSPTMNKEKTTTKTVQQHPCLQFNLILNNNSNSSQKARDLC